MENKALARNCWEFFNCDDELKSSCYVYKNKVGGFCWALSPIYTNKAKGSPKERFNLESCSDCIWYNIASATSCADDINGLM